MKLKTFACAAALAFAAHGALADDQSLTVDLAPLDADTFTASFSVTHLESGLFVDSIVFRLPPALGSVTGNGAVSFTSVSGPVELVLATVASANGDLIAATDSFANIAIPSMLSFMNGMLPITLTVLGFAGDAFADPSPLTTIYRGSITVDVPVAAIPEPETYALMLAGLAGLGCVARRRKAKAEAALA